MVDLTIHGIFDEVICFGAQCGEEILHSTRSGKMADDVNRSVCFRDNMTSSSDVSLSVTSLRFVFPVAALIALNLVVIVGNSLVIAAVFTHRKLRTVTNTFIARPYHAERSAANKNDSEMTYLVSSGSSGT